MRTGRQRLPEWLRAKGAAGSASHGVRAALRAQGLRTVCEEARCPNAGECFGSGTAAFLILGGVCSRRCGFCAVGKGVPGAVDPGEPARLAAQAAAMKLRHVVITSVTRDDLHDGGAGQFAIAIREVRAALPGSTIEVLVPDFAGSMDALQTVLHERPDVLNHNVETVEDLYAVVRPAAVYGRSLALLKRAASDGGVVAKSGLMVGLGEDDGQLRRTFADLARTGVRMLTIGQYLQPRLTNLPVMKYYHPDEFAELGRLAREAGIPDVFSAPLVRSSYHAGEKLAGLL